MAGPVTIGAARVGHVTSASFPSIANSSRASATSPAIAARGHHDRRHEERAPGRRALPALEVAVRRRRAELRALRACRGSSRGTSSSRPRGTRSPASRKIAIVARAGRAPARTACEPGTTSAFTCGATWNAAACRCRTTSSKSESAAVGARADEGDVDLRALHRLARRELHVRGRPRRRAARSSSGKLAGDRGAARRAAPTGRA